MNIQEAAKAAALGDNEPLWGACWEIAKAQGWTTDFRISNQEMCERAIRQMSPEMRRLYGVTV
jgi:hypothetical protein